MIISIVLPHYISEQLARDLRSASIDGDTTRVSALLKQGADPNHPVFWREEFPYYPPLHCACRNKHLPVVKLLVEEGGADVERGDEDYHQTALHHACEVRSKPIVEYLVETAKCRTG